MGIFIQTDCLVIVNGVTLSDHANQITVNDERTQVDVTAFGATNLSYAKGLGDGSIEIVLFQDYAAGKTHATLQPLIGSSTGVAVEVRPTSAARSATNPAALGSSMLLFTYNFLSGSINDAAVTTAMFQLAPGGTFTYPTA
jgi:hypothetical protein